ncbi:MAG: hypothetical protein HWE13_12435 [Gammaproteobacteria bacterium]|nr:hypothetical protein [Gammaproteobacteria bacterium]NVK88933.1 hypothetical protein [Gammaproteobacteria bacterium]
MAFYLLALVVIVLFLVWLKNRAPMSRMQSETPIRELIRLCQGDVNLAERLINLELNRSPKLSLERAVDNAIYHLRTQR